MQNAIRKVISLDFGITGSYPVPPAVPEAAAGEKLGHVLLLSADGASQEWAPRWLAYRGMELTECATLEQALTALGELPVTTLVVDAALKDITGRKAYAVLADKAAEDVRAFVLCGSQRDVREVSEYGKAEVVRRPFDWDIISRRISRSAEAQRLQQELDRAREALQSARLSAADAERDLLSMRGMDPLTGLPARERFRALVHRAIGTVATDASAGVLVLQLDRFRDVNEMIGHEAGNRLLKQFAERIRRCLQDRTLTGGDCGLTMTAAFGRLGGVRFGLVMSRAGADEMQRIRQAIMAELERPFEVDGQSIYLSATMGAAFFPENANTADTLLHCAERAMQDARSAGSSFRAFSGPTCPADRRALRMESMLRQALVNGELRLAYQPILDWHGRRIIAAEALLRWDQPEEGAISPAEFVPVAEQCGLMLRIGDFVIRSAMRQLRDWIEAGMRPVRIAINLSLCQLLDADIAGTVARELEATGVDPSLLEFELSERGVLNQRPEIIEQIYRLKALGVRISVDDFGTGNAAVAYLKDIPADVIKIDRSYVSGPGRTNRDEAIGAGMVALAKRLNAVVIGEGVETEAQLRRLREWGCDQFQGFHFAAALEADDFAARLRQP